MMVDVVNFRNIFSNKFVSSIKMISCVSLLNSAGSYVTSRVRPLSDSWIPSTSEADGRSSYNDHLPRRLSEWLSSHVLRFRGCLSTAATLWRSSASRRCRCGSPEQFKSNGAGSDAGTRRDYLYGKPELTAAIFAAGILLPGR